MLDNAPAPDIQSGAVCRIPTLDDWVSITDEKTKLLANTLDRASTTCLALGVIAPLAAAFYAIGPKQRAESPVLVIGALIWLLAAVALHLIARWILNRLTQ